MDSLQSDQEAIHEHRQQQQQQQPPQTSKLSFSLVAKTKSKALATDNNKKKKNLHQEEQQQEDEEDEEQPRTEYVSEFDPNKPSAPKKQKIIPRQENTWRPELKMKNIHLPSSSSSEALLQFEAENPNHAHDSFENVVYGLNIRTSNNENQQEKENEDEEDEKKRVLREEILDLPDEMDTQAYEKVPVEDFAAALLKGMGWNESDGIGKRRQVVQPVQYVRRVGREGLGADPAAAIATREKHDPSKEKTLQHADTKEKTLKHDRDRKEEQNHGNGDRKRHSEEEHGSSKDRKHHHHHHHKSDRDRNRERQRESSHRDRDKGRKSSHSDRERESSGRAYHHSDEGVWLRSHIRVRVISKDLKKGRLYLKKGRIVDVVDPGTCDVLMDDSGVVVQGVKQDMLETALPKKGGLVLVVDGRHKGLFGRLLERNSEAGVGVVQQQETFKVLKLSLDHIAEFVGDTSDMDY